MDDTVDALYRKYLYELIVQQKDQDNKETLLTTIEVFRADFRSCILYDILNAIHYIVTGR